MSDHEPIEIPLEEGEEDVEAHMLKEALAAGAASAALFAGQAAAHAATPGQAVGAAVKGATAQARLTEEAPEQLAVAAEWLADSARSLEFQLALLESASSEDPEMFLVYAGPVEDAVRVLVESQRSALDVSALYNVEALVQFVLRASYLQTQDDLRSFAEKVKYFNTVKKVVRDEVAALIARLEQDVKTTLYASDLMLSLPEKT